MCYDDHSCFMKENHDTSRLNPKLEVMLMGGSQEYLTIICVLNVQLKFLLRNEQMNTTSPMAGTYLIVWSWFFPSLVSKPSSQDHPGETEVNSKDNHSEVCRVCPASPKQQIRFNVVSGQTRWWQGLRRAALLGSCYKTCLLNGERQSILINSCCSVSWHLRWPHGNSTSPLPLWALGAWVQNSQGQLLDQGPLPGLPCFPLGCQDCLTWEAAPTPYPDSHVYLDEVWAACVSAALTPLDSKSLCI